MTWKQFSLFGFLMFIVMCFAYSASAQQDPKKEKYFYSGGKKVSIQVVTDRIAIRWRKAVDKTMLKSLVGQYERLDDTKEIVEFPDQRITIIPLRKALTRQNLSSFMLQLSSDALVEQVGTVILVNSSNAPMVMTNRLVLQFKKDIANGKMREVLEKYELETVRVSKQRPGRMVLQLKEGSGGNVLDIANRLYESGLVKFAHPDFYAKTVKRTLPNQPVIPNDTLFNDQWHLNNIGQGGGSVDADVDAPEAWDFVDGSSNVVIAVLDDGIQWNHPDLQTNVVAGSRDFTANPPDNDPSPGNSDNHGTAVAGVAVAQGNNNLGVSGSCPDCGLMPIRMLGGSIADHADAFDHAVAQGAWIITNSWGYDIGTPVTDDIEHAIDDAALLGRNNLGTIVLFAMTNQNVDNCVLPTPDISAMDNVIAVSRSTNQDLLGNAGFGDCMDLIAPTRGGTLGITTTDRTGNDGYVIGDYYDNFGGTSSATPLVAGIAGLLLDLNLQLTRQQVQDILEQTADKIDANNANYDESGFSTTHGWGRVNAHRAIVPTVRITTSKPSVRKNELFDITVTATAPYGLTALWWFGQNTGITELDKAHWQSANSEPVLTHTWKDVSISEPGTYTLGSNARDIRYPTPGDGYPHQASEGGGIDTTRIVVTPFTTVAALMVFGLLVLLSGSRSLRNHDRRESKHEDA